MSETGERRFRPSRAGIIGLWDFVDEEFLFAGGWLVLRGPNGSGKTKAMELLYPFVLDGRTDPRRLNPFESQHRTMKENILYRGQELGQGYAWLEFERADDRTGENAWVTVGVGLRAHHHGDQVETWYFVADGRVGRDVLLIGEDQRPLGRRQLAEQLGEERVLRRSADHRRAVDARLFRLGEERYEQMLSLLLTLRRPQLAKDLDPAELSRVLAQGLRPLDDDLLAEAARSFDDLEAVARVLDGLRQADQAMQSFLAIYGTYVRSRARAAADAVESRAGERRDLVVELARARQAAMAAVAAVDATEAMTAAAQAETQRLEGERSGLMASPAYQEAGQIDDLARFVLDLERQVDHGEEEVRATEAIRRRRQERLAEAVARRSTIAHAVAEASARLDESARAAGIAWSAADSAAEGLGERSRARLVARRSDLLEARAALALEREAERAHAQAEAAWTRAETALAEAEEGASAATAALARARADVASAVEAWGTRHATVLGESLGEAWVALVLTPLTEAALRLGEEGAGGLEEHLGGLLEPVRDGLGRQGERLALRAAERSAALDEREAERARVERGEEDAPAPPVSRPAPRPGRAGGAVWQLVDFAPDLPAEGRAGLEAALEASGLLDAWLWPDEASEAWALAEGLADLTVTPLPEGRRPGGPTLAEALVPAGGDRVPAERVRALLASVALGDTTLADGRRVATVDLSGRFRVGPEVGAYQKAAAEYIGPAAREGRRQRRLLALDETIGALRADVDAARAEAAVAERRLLALSAAAQDLPAAAPVHEAARRLTEAAGIVRARRQGRDEARSLADRALAELGAGRRERERLLRDRAIAGGPEGIERTAAAVDRFEADALALERWAAEESEARRHEAAAERDLDEATAEHERRSLRLSGQRARHLEEKARLESLRAATGGEAATVQARLEALEAEIAVARQRLDRAQAEERVAAAARAAGEERVHGLERAVAAAVSEEQRWARTLEPFAARDLLGLLGVSTSIVWPLGEAEWQAAREADGETALPAAVATLLQAIDTATHGLQPTESSLRANASRLSGALEELESALAAAGPEYRLRHLSTGDVVRVEVNDEDGPVPATDFAARVAERRADQEALLSERERHVLEDAVLTRLAGQIHARTVDARDLVERMNEAMRARRTSSGTRVGLRWQLADDLDEGQRSVGRLLEADAATLGPEQLAAVREHFLGRIRAARSREGVGSYREILAVELDYRRWRTFVLYLYPGAGAEERLTRRRHSQLSGGEQSVSLHLPLFAAAHVTFASAAPEAPRLVALDEAFAGVDETGRAELLALAVQFDLDLFMTGYDLMVAFPAVPAAAHYDLAHDPASHAVNTMLMLWQGRATEPLAAEHSLAAYLQAPLASASAMEGTGAPAGAKVAPTDGGEDAR